MRNLRIRSPIMLDMVSRFTLMVYLFSALKVVLILLYRLFNISSIPLGIEKILPKRLTCEDLSGIMMLLEKFQIFSKEIWIESGKIYFLELAYILFVFEI